MLLGGAVVDAILGVVLLLAYRAAWRARYRLSFLWPGSYRALQSMADVLVTGEPETISPLRVADNVEAYLSKMAAHRRWIYRLALYGMQAAALACRGVPLSELEPNDRRAFLEMNFRKLPRWPPIAKNMLRAGIRVGQQLSFAGYYNDPDTDASVGYERYKVRNPREAELRSPLELDVERPDTDELETEVCIVGSGAGGAILAYELATAGHDVLVLERGKYLAPRYFTDNEVDMIGQLYADGVMQQTEDFNFTVLQGSCVGGSTTVNNAVCFRPPQPVLERWNDHNAGDAGLDLGELASSVEHIERFIRHGAAAGADPQPVVAALRGGRRGRRAVAGEARGRRGEREHQGLPRLRLLQHRLRLRPQAVHARHGRCRRASASRTGGCASWPTARCSGSAP